MAAGKQPALDIFRANSRVGPMSGTACMAASAERQFD
ncbi:hypothetical protein GobsT_42790 [Gemmata obscuriglobus]|nr:hypothetical protein GobsT_42790 [Gemmata obscuriglobus]VTS08639.1 unnamed protein product [Gemmata obscuriglobus UQM 2246]